MGTMTIERITELQKEYGLTKAQNLLNAGDLFKFEGSVGRSADDMLESGILILPEEVTYDYYGNAIPPRSAVKEGTKGSVGLAIEFWSEVENGNDNAVEYVEQYRDFMSF